MRTVRSRRALALGLAVGAVLFAGLGALGPAKRARTSYRWPPTTLPASATPSRMWYSPLLLTRAVPESVEATIPCRGLSPPLDAAAPRTTVLATMRHPEAHGGLSIVSVGGQLSFRYGTAVFARAAVPRGAKCSAVSFALHGDRWSLRSPRGRVETGDLGGAVPSVSGLFSGLDLRKGSKPTIVVTTYPYGAHPSWLQWPGWTLGILLALAAFVAAFGRPRASRRLARRGIGTKALVSRLRPVDGVVAAVVLTWWIVGPILYDDGWVKVRQANGLVGDGFSNYYDTFGANLPLDFWSEWLQHWVVAHSTTLLILRLPTLALLAGTWIICRRVLARLLAGTPSAAAEWALGLAFSLNVVAWAITLRPEPIVALLLISVMALAVSFEERASAWKLAIAGLLVALAIAAHPAGLITLAPLLAVGPSIVAWARGQGWFPLATIGLAFVALIVVLFTIGSDAHQRLSEAHLARTAGNETASWRDELTRYQFAGGEGTILRRGSVALMIAAVVGYLARRRTGSRLDLAGTSLVLALILLVATPSKWAWHFGALVGLAAVAVAAEVARLCAEREALRLPVRALAAVGVALLVFAWSWEPRVDYYLTFGLRTLSWTLPFESHVTIVRLGLVTAALIFSIVALVTWSRRGRAGLLRVPWAFVPWLVPFVVVPLVAFNIGMFLADTHKTHAWTVTRQNLRSLSGRAGCGLADDTLVADPSSVRAVPPLGSVSPAIPGWLRSTGVPTPLAFPLLGRGETRVTLPWFQAPSSERVGFYLLTGAEGDRSTLVRWGVDGKHIRALPWSPVDEARLDPVDAAAIPWTFVPETLLPPRPSGADAVQMALASNARPPESLAASGAVTYRTTTLSSLLRGRGSPALVWPNLILYMPCAKIVRLAGGAAQVPSLLVAHSGFWPLVSTTGSFQGLTDLYPLRDLSVADSKVAPQGVSVVWVDRHIPGAALAPAVATGA